MRQTTGGQKDGPEYADLALKGTRLSIQRLPEAAFCFGRSVFVSVDLQCITYTLMHVTCDTAYYKQLRI